MDEGSKKIGDMFRQGGLGDIVDSWIETRESKPITSDQIEQGFGPDQITALTEKV